jgi:hypothetical protein
MKKKLVYHDEEVKRKRESEDSIWVVAEKKHSIEGKIQA